MNGLGIRESSRLGGNTPLRKKISPDRKTKKRPLNWEEGKNARVGQNEGGRSIKKFRGNKRLGNIGDTPKERTEGQSTISRDYRSGRVKKLNEVTQKVTGLQTVGGGPASGQHNLWGVCKSLGQGAQLPSEKNPTEMQEYYSTRA